VTMRTSAKHGCGCFAQARRVVGMSMARNITNKGGPASGEIFTSGRGSSFGRLNWYTLCLDAVHFC
jgi:hypothetical protein